MAKKTKSFPQQKVLETFGARLRFARKNKKVKAKDLAVFLHMTRQNLYLIEKGYSSKFDTNLFEDLSAFLGVSPSFWSNKRAKPYDNIEYFDPSENKK